MTLLLVDIYRRCSYASVEPQEWRRAVVPTGLVVLTILDISRSNVRVGVSTPANVHVYRGEVWERMEQGPPAEEVAVHAGLARKPRRKG